MSTTIKGLKPTGPAGEAFSPGSRWIEPLANFLEHTEDELADAAGTEPIYDDYRLWYANNGRNLNEEGCLQIAAMARKALDAGKASGWAMSNGHPWKTGENGNTVYHIGNPCMLFSEECLLHFINFLETCGGFEVT